MQGEIDIPDTFEEWRDIKGYEGQYQVSNLGRVRSLDSEVFINAKKRQKHFTFRRGKIRKPVYRNGYHYYCLGHSDVRAAHRLVAEAFLDNLNDKPHINHKDGVRDNNILSNLEWVDRSENEKHKIYTLKNGKNLIHEPHPVKCIETGMVFPSMAKAGEFLGKKRVDHISDVCRGLRPMAYGFHWRYADGTEC